MVCVQCGHDNAHDAFFCEACGSALPRECANCGTANTTSAKFCKRCGSVLAIEKRVAAAASATPDGERRQLTVMFADLVDSTPLSGRLDPEDLRDTVRRYHAACAASIERWGGHVGHWLGDGVLAYFGYPSAHEDDARRAIRAGLEIVAWARQLDGTERDPVRVRVGLHSGLVVIAEMGAGERIERADIVGETPNVAARVEAAALPNTVLISDATERLAHGFFATESDGKQQLKGVRRSIELFRVIGESGAASRLDTAELTPLVGREHETAILLDRWHMAQAGRAQVVMLSGEPGIGKSRLARTLHERLASHVRIELQCSQFAQNSALFPLIEHYQRLIASGAGEPIDRLAAMLDEAGLNVAAVLPLFARLLELPIASETNFSDQTPEQLKQKTFEAALEWLQAESRRHAVLLTCEDLHWVDPSTLELVGMLVERSDAAQLLTLLTFRPEFLPPWPPYSHVTAMALNRLDRTEAEEVMARVAGGRRLPSQFAAEIVDRTDGVPLFVEELTKMVLESGLLRVDRDEFVVAGAVPALAIPDTLQDSLMARLDRLGACKETAQLGATLGREFSGELISAVSLLAPDRLIGDLNALVDSGLAFRRGSGTGTRYAFKHALIQDAAYQSLLRTTRVRYHQRIADSLVERFPRIAAAQPELVAHHYAEAGATDQAIKYWHLAGVRARERSADREAIAHLTRGLRLLEALPASVERDRSELELQITLGPALRATRGYTGEGVEPAFARASELCERLGDDANLLPALWGLWSFHMVQAHHERSCELAERCLQLAEKEGNAGHVAQAHRALGTARFWIGDFESAKRHNDLGAGLYDRGAHASYTLTYGIDVGVGCLAWSAWSAWYLGFPDEALRKAHDARTLAQSLSHPFSLGLAHCWTAGVYLCRREGAEAERHAREGVRIAMEHGIAQWRWYGSVMAGRALAQRGHRDDASIQMRAGIDGWIAMGAYTELPAFQRATRRDEHRDRQPS